MSVRLQATHSTTLSLWASHITTLSLQGSHVTPLFLGGQVDEFIPGELIPYNLDFSESKNSFYLTLF